MFVLCHIQDCFGGGRTSYQPLVTELMAQIPCVQVHGRAQHEHTIHFHPGVYQIVGHLRCLEVYGDLQEACLQTRLAAPSWSCILLEAEKRLCHFDFTNPCNRERRKFCIAQGSPFARICSIALRVRRNCGSAKTLVYCNPVQKNASRKLSHFGSRRHGLTRCMLRQHCERGQSALWRLE